MKSVLLVLLLTSQVSINAFVVHPPQNNACWATRLAASKKEFGNESSKGGSSGGKGFAKTYGEEARAVIKDVIDAEGAMSEFFSSNEEWHPLFRSLASSSRVPAMSFMQEEGIFDFDNNGPWRRLEGIPSGEKDKAVVAAVLDSMHASLAEIPVDEETKEDDNDLTFLEEGRRMLAISRFQVLRGVTGGSVDCYDTLFSTCWSELTELSLKDEENTGSLIVIPEYDLSDLKRFTDINLLRPMEWLGLHVDFEVASMHRGSPAIRLLHKLQDMPDEPWNGEEEGELSSDSS